MFFTEISLFQDVLINLFLEAVGTVLPIAEIRGIIWVQFNSFRVAVNGLVNFPILDVDIACVNTHISFYKQLH